MHESYASTPYGALLAAITARIPDRCKDSDRCCNKMILIGTPDWGRGMIFR
jgi:hypothetical protein